ncbi:MAG: nuclease [Acidobacteriaceae bacterium]
MTRPWLVLRFAMTLAMLPAVLVEQSLAWGSDGHRMINRLAVMTLPKELPAFLRNGEALDAIEYLGPEPDRWKSRAEEELATESSPDHYIDLEWADLAGPLPHHRYDFVRALVKTQAEHPNLTLTAEKVGMQPYAAVEVWERLKAAMREYRALAAANSDTKPVELAILFYAGWLGHYVGDGSQPLHVSIQYNGWTGANPKGYTTEHTIHSQFESTFVSFNIKQSDVAVLVQAAPAKALQGDIFDDYMEYLRRSGTMVERTYQMEKMGGFADAGTAESRSFTAERLAAGAIELRDLIDTAWVRSADALPGPRQTP